MTDNGAKLPENEKTQEDVDLAAEFAELGRKIRETVSTAWHSEERQKIQQDLKVGLEKFTEEMNKAAKSLRDSDAGVKVEEGVKKVHADVKSGKVGEDVRKGTIKALRAMGEALDKMADSFTDETPKE